jgi:hypothetical protein
VELTEQSSACRHLLKHWPIDEAWQSEWDVIEF